MNPISFKFNESDLERLNSIQEKLGLPNRMAVMRLALLQLDSSYLPEVVNKSIPKKKPTKLESLLKPLVEQAEAIQEYKVSKKEEPTDYAFQICPKHHGFYNSCGCKKK